MIKNLIFTLVLGLIFFSICEMSWSDIIVKNDEPHRSQIITYPSSNRTTTLVQPNSHKVQSSINFQHQENQRRHDHDYHRHNRIFIAPSYIYFNSYPYYYKSNEDDSYYYTTPSSSTNINSETIYQSDMDNSLPEGNWVVASDGQVPDNAIIYNDVNNATTYYCRAIYRDQMYYGVLILNDACYIKDQSATIRFDQYDVLVSN